MAWSREGFIAQLERHPLCYMCDTRPHADNDRRCNECRRKYSKILRKRNGPGWYRELTLGQKEKKRARAVVHVSIKRGRMKRMPCEVCGNPKAEAHHCNGYSPENNKAVRFFCKKHHLEIERIEKILLTDCGGKD